MKTAGTGIFWCCLAGSVFGQATFEVASVKPSPPDAPGMFYRANLAGDVNITGATLKNLISYAYGNRPFQITGGPKWVDTDRFDVAARTVRGEQRKTAERLRSLLAARFQLTLHPETREQPVYALVVAKGGTKLQESTESENLIRRIGRGELKGQGVSLTMLVVNLSSELGRRVIDKTGLTAKYSFDLKWTPAGAQTQLSDSDVPSIFTALQEQLGLRLESEKGPVEFLVIDRAEKPSTN